MRVGAEALNALEHHPDIGLEDGEIAGWMRVVKHAMKLRLVHGRRYDRERQRERRRRPHRYDARDAKAALRRSRLEAGQSAFES